MKHNPFADLPGIFSFENGVPEEWSVTNGNLGTTQLKAKLGNSSLLWEWSGGSIVTAPVESIRTTSNQNNGGITVWIYNTVYSEDSVYFAFNDEDSEKCRIGFRLNFVGWRCLWARYIEDMGLTPADKGKITTMKLIAPVTGNGRIYLDYLEFITNVSWEKISDYQHTVVEAAGIESFLTIREVPALPPVIPTEEQRQAVQTILGRLDNWYYGSGENEGNPYYEIRANSMRNYIRRGVNNTPDIAPNGTIDGSGLYPHYFYNGKTVDGIKLVSSRNVGEGYMLQLAYDYKVNGNEESLSKALEYLDWYYDQGWADGSALGSLRFEMLRSAGYFHSAFMLRDELGEERRQLLSDAFHWFTLFGVCYTTPANPGDLADYVRTLAIPKLFYALTIPGEAERNTALIAYRDYLENTFRYAQGFLGSMKADGSGYHHHAPYYSAYYPQVLYIGCLACYILHDTPFALSEETYQHLKASLLAFRFFSAKYNVPGSTGGRFPHQTEILQQLIPAFAFYVLARPDQEVIAAFKRLWDPEYPSVNSYLGTAKTDISYTATFGEIDAVLQATRLTGVAENNPAGTRFYPFSGLLVARRTEWTVTVKGFSKFIWDYESSGTENLYGRYLSYDHIEYTDLVNGYRSFELVKADTDGLTEWDWNLLPGTTTRYLDKDRLSYLSTDGKHRNFSDEAFLGGIALKENAAMFTNRIHDNAIDTSFYADKSVFVFDNVVYCMGSGIRDEHTDVPFFTTLFQNKSELGSGSIIVNGVVVNTLQENLSDPVIRDNYGNVYLVHNGRVTVKPEENYLVAAIQHGNEVVDSSYNYTWFIQPQPGETDSYQSEPWIEVLRQDDGAHAVYNSKLDILAASVFTGDIPVKIREIYQINLPLLVMIAKEDDVYEVAFSNPDMDRPSAANNDKITDEIAEVPGALSEIILQLQGVYSRHPQDSGDVGISVSEGITTLVYSTAQDGQTYRVKLVRDSNE